MTKEHVALKLLEHGGLRLGEFVEITGWDYRMAERVLYKLYLRCKIERAGPANRHTYYIEGYAHGC